MQNINMAKDTTKKNIKATSEIIFHIHNSMQERVEVQVGLLL